LTESTALAQSPTTLQLDPKTVELLRRPIRGRGGWQSLLRRIQGGLRGRELVVDPADIQALIRMSSRGGIRRAGGFQTRVLALLTDVVLNRWHEPPASPQLALPFAPRPPQTPLTVIRGGRL
jgi:hypothetical protein